jgi:queuine tRNA-ribosyltransferase
MSYIHHLIKSDEILGMELTSKHNLTFYLWLMEQIRKQIDDDTFHKWYPGMIEKVEQRI